MSRSPSLGTLLLFGSGLVGLSLPQKQCESLNEIRKAFVPDTCSNHFQTHSLFVLLIVRRLPPGSRVGLGVNGFGSFCRTTVGPFGTHHTNGPHPPGVTGNYAWEIYPITITLDEARPARSTLTIRNRKEAGHQ